VRFPGARYLGTGVIGLGVLVLLVQAASIWDFTIDDAFITFRYAENLAAGHGPTYNAGQPPVEGYTTFLWMLLMAIPHLVGWDAVTFSKLLGVGAALGLMAVCYRFAARLVDAEEHGERSLIASAPVALLGVIPFSAVHAVSGMETTLFALLVMGFLYALYRALEAPSAGGLAGWRRWRC
jgi:hypothetical protein